MPRLNSYWLNSAMAPGSSGCWVLRLLSSSVKPAIYSPTGPAVQSTRSTVQRFIGGQRRIALAGEGLSFFFVHRQNRDMLFQEGLPPLRVVGNHKFCSQRQDHRHIVLFAYSIAFMVASGIGSPGLQRTVGGEHQRRRARNHLFGNALGTQLVMWPG